MLADLKEETSIQMGPSGYRGYARRDRARRALKRTFDLVVALVLLLAVLPLMLSIAALIWIQGGRPIFFAHERVGRNGQAFACLKFRTMVPDAGEALSRLLASSPKARAEWALTQKLRDDPRVLGSIGRFLRQSSLDELPQLLNVVRGHMSLVGPRPVVRSELQHYELSLHWYLSTRPGLTGPWQISGRSDTSYATRVKLDIDYAMNPSLRRDIAILLRTPVAVLTGKGAC